jgi:glycosyltransferase involved in cell wall biosynthesis
LKSTVNKINKSNYDSIIAFQEGFPTFFCSQLKANNKIAWIHSNYEEYIKLSKKDEQHIYSNFDHIICVSAFTMKAFLNFFPQYHEKTRYIYNVLDENFIKEQSTLEIEDSRFDNSLFTIISIGRIDRVKQFSKLPHIAYKLKQKNLKFKWYLLGDGYPSELELILKNIVFYNVEDCFVYLGSKFNPYPYIASSNLLVSSSFSEACPYVVNEAKILGVPVVSTNYGSSYEFINDEVNGYITTLDKIDIIIEQLINNKDAYTQIKSNLETFVYDNETIVRQLVEIL